MMDTQNRLLIERLQGKLVKSIALFVVAALVLLMVSALMAGGIPSLALEPDQTSPMRDYGDAPDAEATPEYPTLEINNGASHEIVEGFYLGQCVEAERDGLPDNQAEGDDRDLGIFTSGTCQTPKDDEDGVVFQEAGGNSTKLVICETTTIEVTLTDAASRGGYLWAWVDFNHDGDWNDAGEQVFGAGVGAQSPPQSLAPGQNSLSFEVPCDAVITDPADATDVSFMRVRLYDADTGLADDGSGPATSGEVEDYAVDILALDYGDAPDNPDTPQYPTLAANSGAAHAISATGPILGACADAESEGQPATSSDGDDTNSAGAAVATIGNCQQPGDDEDGVTLPGSFTSGSPSASATVEVAQADCLLNAWIDFNIDGDWEDPGEQIFANESLAVGSNSLSFSVPGNAVPGSTYARFRCSTGRDLAPGGFAVDGEVEDYPLEIVQGNVVLDWADAPDSVDTPRYPTLDAHGGANHVMRETSNSFLGQCVDSEADGIPTAQADGDDLDTSGSSLGFCLSSGDEDGVDFTLPLLPGDAAAEVDIQVSGTACDLNAWIDFNGDDDWDDAGEQIFADVPLNAGGHTLEFPVPGTAVPGTTYARFRCNNNGGLPPDGPAPDGEVEDYQVEIGQADIALDWGDAPSQSYPTLAADGGANHVVVAGGPIFGACIDAETDGQPNGQASGDDLAEGDGAGCATPGDDEDGIAFTSAFVPGAKATIEVSVNRSCTLSAFVDFNGDGDWTDGGENLFPAGLPLPGHINVIDFDVPADARPGATYARFRCTSAGVLPPDGPALDGEVEDYELFIDTPLLDFGDLPDGYGTLATNNGANHTILATDNPGLGSLLDPEPNGVPSLAADGDNLVADDDEDGVAAVSTWSDGSGEISVVVTGADACLNAWLDFTDGASPSLPEGDGDFDDVYVEGSDSYPEHVIRNKALAPAPDPQIQSFPLPTGAASSGNWYMRVRLTPRDGDGGCTGAEAYGGTAAPFGPATGGEVEDYRFGFSPTAVALVRSQAQTTGSVLPLAVVLSLALLAAGSLFLRRKRFFS